CRHGDVRVHQHVVPGHSERELRREEIFRLDLRPQQPGVGDVDRDGTTWKIEGPRGIALYLPAVEGVAGLHRHTGAEQSTVPAIPDSRLNRPCFQHAELLTVRAVQILTEHRDPHRILHAISAARTESDRWAERRPFRDVRIHRVAEADVSVDADLLNEFAWRSP